jgi:hypothetical protein
MNGKYYPAFQTFFSCVISPPRLALPVAAGAHYCLRFGNYFYFTSSLTALRNPVRFLIAVSGSTSVVPPHASGGFKTKPPMLFFSIGGIYLTQSKSALIRG